MAAHVQGLLEVELDVDDIGNRSYKPKWLVYVDDPYNELAFSVYNCPDLPSVGSGWTYGSEVDSFSWCHPDWKIQQVLSREPGHWWTVVTPFGTRGARRCQDTQIGNPLAEPPNISGSFIKLTKFAAFDVNGKAFKNSAFEVLPERYLELDDNRPTVVIQMNSLLLPLAQFVPMVDSINEAPMWGLAKHMVKLANVSWERKIQGKCGYYFSMTYEFEINKDTWDRRVPDFGSKVYGGVGDRNDPTSYVARRNQFLTEDLESGFLNGNGERLTTNTPFMLSFDVYKEADFFALGIPASFS